MKTGYAADNRESKSRPTRFGSPRRIDAMKPLEDLRRMFRRNADAMVLDDDPRGPCIASDRN